MVSTAVKAVTKLFAGEIIEASRQVQLELIRAGEEQSELPDPNRPVAAAAPPAPEPAAPEVKREEGSATPTAEAAPAAGTDDDKDADTAAAAAAAPSADQEDYDPKRGPLRPEHLREAWRRYRLSGESRGVGVQQLWHAQARNGVDRFSTRTGKRLFK